MRIAYVCTDFGVPILGHQGTAVHVRELSRALQRLGHEVVIVAPRINGPTPDDFDVEVFEFGLEGPERRVYELLNEDPSAGAAAASEIRALLYAATLRYRLHGILNVFRPDAIYERYSPLGSAGQAIARGLGIPLILEVGAPSPGEPAVHRGQAFGQTARELERAVLREADLVVAVSRTLIAWLEQIGVAPERIAAMPTAAEVERFAAGSAARDAIRVNLAPWHGAAMVVRAVAALRRRRLEPVMDFRPAGCQADAAAGTRRPGSAAPRPSPAGVRRRGPGAGSGWPRRRSARPPTAAAAARTPAWPRGA